MLVPVVSYKCAPAAANIVKINGYHPKETQEQETGKGKSNVAGGTWYLLIGIASEKVI